MTIKNILLATFTGFIALSACKEGDESNMKYMEQMQDSILHGYASVYSVTVKVEHSSILEVTLGSAKLYDAPDAARQKVANEIGTLAFRVFPKDNNLEEGKLLVSKDEKSVNIDPATAKTCIINLDSLRIVLAKSGK